MSIRRTAADAREGVRALVEQLGRRAPTSLAEAAAAAHVNGQLRQAGLRVSADPFRLPAPSRAGALLPGLLGLLVAALLAPFPLPSLLLAVWALVVSGLLPLLGAPPLLARWAESQNVVAVRAANAARTWRVVLLARLDSCPPPRGLRAWVIQEETADGLRPIPRRRPLRAIRPPLIRTSSRRACRPSKT